MVDPIATFALRGTTPDELGVSLARCYAEFHAWYGEAIFLSGFTHYARMAGVSDVVIRRINDAINSAEELGLLSSKGIESKTNPHFASNIAEHQLKMADSGVKTAAIVILHNACERLLFRLVRFGLIANRDSALKLIAKRPVSISEIVENDIQDLIDDRLETWWRKLSRDSILKKWDKLVDLMGYPPKLEDKDWHFDRYMLLQFDEIRHNAVHHDGQKVEAFDLDEFARQLQRALIVWFIQVAQKLQLQVPAEVFWGLTEGETEGKAKVEFVDEGRIPDTQ
jgi:hypothetical protein